MDADRKQIPNLRLIRNPKAIDKIITRRPKSTLMHVKHGSALFVDSNLIKGENQIELPETKRSLQSLQPDSAIQSARKSRVRTAKRSHYRQEVLNKVKQMIPAPTIIDGPYAKHNYNLTLIAFRKAVHPVNFT